MSAVKKPVIARQSSCNSLPCRPLGELKHNRSCSEDGNGNGNGCSNYVPLVVHIRQNQLSCSAAGKENSTPNFSEKSFLDDKENAISGKENNLVEVKDFPSGISHLKSKDKPLRPTSLQFCIQKHEPDSNIGTKVWEHLDSDNPNSGNIWDFSDSEAAPASSWSTLPNRSLLYRPLPVDIGRCTCVIVKEASPEEGLISGGTLYSLYTHEGHGRQNRKLAVAHHRRRNGRSEFMVASNIKGILTPGTDDSLIGKMTANFIGSKYQVWDQGRQINSSTKKSKLLAVITFVATITSWTGSYRSIKAWIPKHQSMQLKNASQHINGLANGWEEKKDKAHRLFSRVPYYNKITKQNELDYRDRGRTGLKIQSSVKNFQLTMENNGKQTILQLGRVGKSMYVMDYRYPMTGFQAFCFCLAAIDSKPCCTV